ncbi:MAG TPA: hypothetical protein VGG14_04095 [Candidatus Sulfotelmatobacter sp.]
MGAAADVSKLARNIRTTGGRPISDDEALVAFNALCDLGVLERDGSRYVLNRDRFAATEELRSGVQATVEILRDNKTESTTDVQLCVSLPPSLSPAAEHVIHESSTDLRRVEQRLKTANGFRQVDLHPAIANLLREFVGDRKTGFLFCTRNRKPLSATNIIRRHLHKALMELSYVNPFTGTHKAGNHAFRRFRNTYLRNKTECPDGLRNYWMAHAGNSMDDLYDKIKEDVHFRKMWAEKCGFGFELPSVVPNVPKITEKTEAAKAA